MYGLCPSKQYSKFAAEEYFQTFSYSSCGLLNPIRNVQGKDITALLVFVVRIKVAKWLFDRLHNGII